MWRGHTETTRKRRGITLISQCDSGVITIYLSRRISAHESPETKRYSQPNGQHTEFLHFYPPHLLKVCSAHTFVLKPLRRSHNVNVNRYTRVKGLTQPSQI